MTEISVSIYPGSRVVMSFWSVHNNLDKKDNPNYPPLSGPYHAEKYSAYIKTSTLDDIPAAIATLWRCALATERLLLTGEYDQKNHPSLFCVNIYGEPVQLPHDGVAR